MTDVRSKRLQKELKIIHEDPNIGIDVPHVDNLTAWDVVIDGPPGTPYEGGKYALTIEFPANFPYVPPKIKFVTKIYHPNISMNGDICLDILKDNWAACLTVQKTLLSIMSLLSSPNPGDPLMPDIAHIYINNIEKYNRIARAWTQEFA